MLRQDVTKEHCDPLPLLAVVIALLACGAPNNGAPARHASPQARHVQGEAKRCSNDYACSPGQLCVKDSLAFEGICAQTVNANGIPTYEPPRTNSFGPGSGQCQFDTQCSIGFRCIKTGGGLYGNCMK